MVLQPIPPRCATIEMEHAQMIIFASVTRDGLAWIARYPCVETTPIPIHWCVLVLEIVRLLDAHANQVEMEHCVKDSPARI